MIANRLPIRRDRVIADSKIPMVGLELSVSRNIWINGWSEKQQIKNPSYLSKRPLSCRSLKQTAADRISSVILLMDEGDSLGPV